jgi:hypothetical protein
MMFNTVELSGKEIIASSSFEEVTGAGKRPRNPLSDDAIRICEWT